MKLSKVILLLVGMLTINALAMVEQSCSANLGLLVNNSASLDAEEQAASDFASNHGFTVTSIDPNSIISDPSILNNVCGFWADNGSIPTGFNNQAVIQPLLNAINSGKGILFRQYGGFIGQYLGLGTATSGFWCPVYADAEYFVQAIDDHPVFDGIPTWLDHALPNKPEQLIYRVNAGCKTGAGIDLTNAQVFEIVKIVEAWSPNGHDVQQSGYVFEKSVGQGKAIFLPINGFTLGTLGPVGVTMHTNALNYICSGGQPPQQKSILQVSSIIINDGQPVVSGRLTTVNVTLKNTGALATAYKKVNIRVLCLDRCDYPPGMPSGNPWCTVDNSRTYLFSCKTFENIDLYPIGPGGQVILPVVTVFSGGGYADEVLVVIKSTDGTDLADEIPITSQQPQDWYEHQPGNTWLAAYKDQEILSDPSVNCFWELFSIMIFGPSNALKTAGRVSGYLNGLGEIWPNLTTALSYLSQGNTEKAYEEGWVAARAAFRLCVRIMGNEALSVLGSVWTILEKEVYNRGCLAYIDELKEQFWLMVHGGISELRSIQLPELKLPPIAAKFGCPINLYVRSETGDSLVIDTMGNIYNTIDSAIAMRIFKEDYVFLPSYNIYDLIGLGRDSGECHVALIQPLFNSALLSVTWNPIEIEPNSRILLNSLSNLLSDYAIAVDFDGDGIVDSHSFPESLFAFDGPGYASLSGFVSADSATGLFGVSLDIYDTNGNLWKSLVTDDSGYYHIDSIPNGNYSISVVTPLGYQADQETKEFTIHHVPVTVNFTLTKLAITPRPRTQAYWAHQLEKALQNKPDDYTKRDFSRFVGLINLHFNQNQVNPVDFYTVPQPANQHDSLMTLKKLLHMCQGEEEPFLKRFAKAQLMALMLNVVSGKISQTQIISEDGRTVSQAITYCDMLVNDEINCPQHGPGHGSPHCRYILVDFILTFTNLGLTVPRGLIPEDVIEIAYRIHNQEKLPERFTLEQNYPNPFNPDCEIRYALPADCQVTLNIYNILGQRVRVLVGEYQSAGNKTVHWDGKDDQGQEVTSGVYFYRIQAGDFVQSKKMVLMK